ncbi:hypothetical protein [Curtobacterium sp. MCBD17_040]|uniref:hypothetical protein n=1 Tax=Curtobacterium sp. MCBD17_040 TaxID=2175674 RepID=UPI0024DF6CD8|nr:hypothetical protein [Curtobacterium sp. MCBD17_040]WIB65766.1 hypothetical protein DEI94_16750 [Curtobacterium sp. MCBD17_040]
MPRRTAAASPTASPAAGRTKSGLRVLNDPFVVATPTGVRTKTRLHLSTAETAALERVAVFLGGQYRQTLASRVRLGRLSAEDQATWRATEKRRLTAGTSSRWAGALIRTAIDSYHLGIRGLVAEVQMLRQATDVIGARMAVPVGESAPGAYRRAKPVSGYASQAERFQKSRRKAALTNRLTAASAALEAGRPTIVSGSGRLWRARQNLEAAQLTREQWGARWVNERMFLTADGEAGKRGGNETIRVTPDGLVEVKVPTALVSELGMTHLRLTVPVTFTTHRGNEWAERITGNRAVRYDITRDDRGRWHLHPSWAYPAAPTIPLAALRQSRTLGVDVNGGHLDAAVIDVHGNIVGRPVRINLDVDGLPAPTRDGHLRRAISTLIHLAQQHGCASISIEDLGFDDARTTGRETMGPGNAASGSAAPLQVSRPGSSSNAWSG